MLCIWNPKLIDAWNVSQTEAQQCSDQQLTNFIAEWHGGDSVACGRTVMSCGDDMHLRLTDVLRSCVIKSVMSNVVLLTNNADEKAVLIRFFLEGFGRLLICSLRKLGVHNISSSDEVSQLLLFLVKNRLDAELLSTGVSTELYDGLCLDCLAILTDLGHLRTANSSSKSELTVKYAGTVRILLESSNPNAEIDPKLTNVFIINFCEIAANSEDIKCLCEHVLPLLHKYVNDSQIEDFIQVSCAILTLAHHFLGKPETIETNLKTFSLLLMRVISKLSTVKPSAKIINEVGLTNAYSKACDLLASVSNTKVSLRHDCHCKHKKHRRCDWSALQYHHDDNITLTVGEGSRSCFHAQYLSVLLKVYSAYSKADGSTECIKSMVSDLLKLGPCCCMDKSLVISLLATHFHSLSKTVQSHMMEIICKYTRVNKEGKMPIPCKRCQRKLASTDPPTRWQFLETIYKMVAPKVSSLTREQTIEVIKCLLSGVKHLSVVSNSEMRFFVYQHIARRLLEAIDHRRLWTDLSSEDAVNFVNSLNHMLSTDDSTRDHFLSSSSSMRILENCASNCPSALLPVLKLLQMLLTRGDEDSVMVLLIKLLFGDSEVQTSSDGPIVFEFPLPVMEDIMQNTDKFNSELIKWMTFLDVLHQSQFIRDDLDSKGAVRHLVTLLSLLLKYHFSEHGCTKPAVSRLLDLISVVLSSVLHGAKYKLSQSCNPPCTVEGVVMLLKDVMFTQFDPSFVEMVLNISVGIGRYPVIGQFISCVGSDCLTESTEEEPSGDGYEADMDSKEMEMTVATRSNPTLLVPELWPLLIDVISSCQPPADDVINFFRHFLSLLKASEGRCYHAFQQKCAEQLLESFYDDLQMPGSDLGEVILMIVSEICKVDTSCNIISMILASIKHGKLPRHLIQHLEGIVRESQVQPKDSVWFPIHSTDPESLTLIQKSVDGITQMDATLSFWLNIDNSVGSIYNTDEKGSTIHLLTLSKDDLYVSLSSHVTHGDIILSVSQGGSQIGQPLTTHPLLTTGKWHMVSLAICMKNKDHNQLSMKFAIGLDGKEVKCSTESLNASMNSNLSQSDSDLYLELGQRSSQYIKPETVRLANMLVFKGLLSEVLITFLFIQGPRFDNFTKCANSISLSSCEKRARAVRHAHVSVIPRYLETIHEEHIEKLRTLVVLMISPRYRPYCLVYRNPNFEQPGRVSRLVSISPQSQPTRTNPILEGLAYDALLEHRIHGCLAKSLETIGGSNALLYMLALCVEKDCEEVAQLSALSALLDFIRNHLAASTEEFEFELLARVLQSEQCIIREKMTKLLISFGLRKEGRDWILADARFIEKILLNWKIWHARSSMWNRVWDCMLQSVTNSNNFWKVNINTLLDCETLQKACSIPMLQLYSSEDHVAISHAIVDKALKITRIVVKMSKDKKLLSDLSRLLLLLHPAETTLIQYRQLYIHQSWIKAKYKTRTRSMSRILSQTDGSHLFDESVEDTVSEFIIIPSTDYSTEGILRPKVNRLVRRIKEINLKHALPMPLQEGAYLNRSSSPTQGTDSDEFDRVMANSPNQSPTRDLIDGNRPDVVSSTHGATEDDTELSPPTPGLPESNYWEQNTRDHGIDIEFPYCCGNHPVEQPTKEDIDTVMVHLSAGLLHMFYHVTDGMTQTDKLIFITDVMPADTILVLLNTDSVVVRYQALQLLVRVLEMSTSQSLESFIRRKGFHLMASQLNQSEVSMQILSVCRDLTSNELLEKILKPELLPLTLLPLLGCLRPSAENTNLSYQAFAYLFEVFDRHSGLIETCLQHGLVESLCNFTSAHLAQPDNSNALSDRLQAYIQSVHQLICQTIVRSNSRECLKALTNLFILLDRSLRTTKDVDTSHVASDDAIRRLEFVVGTIFREIYSTVKIFASGIKTMSRMKRALSIVTGSKAANLPTQLPIRDPNFNCEASGGFSSSFSKSFRDSGQYSETSASFSRGSSSTSDSKANQSSLTAVFVSAMREFADYCLYRDKSLKNDRQLFVTLMDMLLDALADQQNLTDRSTVWYQIIQTQRNMVLSLLSELMTVLMSPICDKETAEQCIIKLSQFSDQTQRTILGSIPITSNLMSNLRHFLSNHALKSSVETILNRLLKLGASRDGAPSNWLENHNKLRVEWKSKLSKNRIAAFHWLDPLNKDIIVSAMDINKDVVYRQNLERKKFVERMKNSIASDVSMKNKWQTLIKHLTHERAVWHDPDTYPVSWELDSTEGPGRVRPRLQRCQLRNIPAKFLMSDFKFKAEISARAQPLSKLLAQQQGTGSASAAIIYRLHTSERIMFTCKCSNVTIKSETLGDLLISDECIHFVGDKAIMENETEVLTGDHEMLSISWQLSDLKCFYKRRHELQDRAIEIFLTTGRTCLLALDSVQERDILWAELQKLPLPSRMNLSDVESILNRWQAGQITNWEYLMHLNTHAGRSFNDLMQYPVFPFILNDYGSESLDLTDASVYRKLNKPISCQNPTSEERYKSHYQAIEADIEMMKSSPDKSSHLVLGPYHYASHYSNSGVVLHFLVRLLPYTHMFLKYQDGQFDIPDRTFHSMQTSFQLTSERSTTDVKELIPEFFYLPEFMTNYEGLDLGLRDKGQRVNDLNLPPWCSQDPRQFVLVLRQALESNHATKNLHNWINLIFGFQQQGKAAVDAVNIFHPSTYFGVEVDSIEDELHRESLRVMIKTYGQMPKQLFLNKHPEAIPSACTNDRPSGHADVINVIDTVRGLSWGHYVGSPADELDPEPIRNELVEATKLCAVHTGDILGMTSSSFIITHETKSSHTESRVDSIWAALVTWSKCDGVLRVTSRRDKDPFNLTRIESHVTAILATTDCRLLLIATELGTIEVHSIEYTPEQNQELKWVEHLMTLTGHSHKITQLVLSPQFSVLVSTDSNGLVILWDLNKLTYVRSVRSNTENAVTAVTVSPTLGDIAFSSSNHEGLCYLELYTVNMTKVTQTILADCMINWLCYSSAPEGRSVNVIAAALTNGTIRLFSSWDLKHVRTITIPQPLEAITCCVYTSESSRLAATTSGGRLLVWERSKSIKLSTPWRFIMVQ